MLKRFSNLFKSFMNLFLKNVESANPEAMLELEKENLRKQIANYNSGMATQAGLCEKLMGIIKKQEKELKEAKAKAIANAKAGNTEVAGKHALRVQTLTTQLEESTAQLDTAEKTLKDLEEAKEVAVTQAQSKLEEVGYAINDMKVKKAQAEMTEMASGMISTIGGSGDNLNRLHEQVEEQRNQAAGRARVAKSSLDMSGIQMKDAENDALGDMALADLLASEGIAIDTKASTEKKKSMGSDAAIGQS